MVNIQYEDLLMLRFSNTKLSMFHNLLSVGEVQMIVFDAIFFKQQIIVSAH